MKKLWPYIKELEDLAIYFPDMKPDQYPDRDYMWTVISTLRTDVTQKLVKQARDHRSVTREENNEELVEVDPEIFREIKSILTQKRKILILIFPIIVIQLRKEGSHFY